MKPLSTLLFVLLFGIANGQAPAWDWVRGSRGMLNAPSAVAADAFGNVYVAGQFDTTASFGNIFLASIPSDVSHNDIFLVKYSSTGDALWAKRVGANSSSYPNSLAVDGQGNAYVTGVAVAPDSVGSVPMTDTGMYIAKYSPLGDLLWAKQLSVYPTQQCIACDEHGNLFVTGGFKGQLSMDTHSAVSLADLDFFLAKINSNGHTVTLAAGGGGPGDQRGALMTSNGKHIFLVVQEANLPHSVTKWDTSCSIQYMTATVNQAAIMSLAADADNNLYVAENGAIEKFNSQGFSVWQKQLYFGASYSSTKDIAVDNSSARNVYVTGYLKKLNSNDMPSVTLGMLKLQSTAKNTDFIMQLNANGEPVWGKMVYGDDHAYTEVQGLSIDALGNIYMTGQAGGNCAFDAHNLVMDTVDVITTYLTRLGSTTSIKETQAISNNTSIYPNPTTGIITIDLNNQPATEISLHDITGRRLRSLELTATQKQASFDMSDLAVGVYYLQVMSDSGLRTERVVLRR